MDIEKKKKMFHNFASKYSTRRILKSSQLVSNKPRFSSSSFQSSNHSNNFFSTFNSRRNLGTKSEGQNTLQATLINPNLRKLTNSSITTFLTSKSRNKFSSVNFSKNASSNPKPDLSSKSPTNTIKGLLFFKSAFCDS